MNKIAEMEIDIKDIEGMEKDGEDIQLYELFGIVPYNKNHTDANGKRGR